MSLRLACATSVVLALASLPCEAQQQCGSGEVRDPRSLRCVRRADRRPLARSSAQIEEAAEAEEAACQARALAEAGRCGAGPACDTLLEATQRVCRAEFYARLPPDRARLRRAQHELAPRLEAAVEAARGAARQAEQWGSGCGSILVHRRADLGAEVRDRCAEAAQASAEAQARRAEAEEAQASLRAASDPDAARRVVESAEAAAAAGGSARDRASAAYRLVEARAGEWSAVAGRAASAASLASAWANEAASAATEAEHLFAEIALPAPAAERARAARALAEQARRLAEQASAAHAAAQSATSIEESSRQATIAARAAVDAQRAAEGAGAERDAVREARAQVERRERATLEGRQEALSGALSRSHAWASRESSARLEGALTGLRHRPSEWLTGPRWTHVGAAGFHWFSGDADRPAWALGIGDLRMRLWSPLFLGLGPLLIGNGLGEEGGIAIGLSAAAGVYLLSLPAVRHRVQAGDTWGEGGSSLSLLNPHGGLRLTGYVSHDDALHAVAALELGNTFFSGPFSISGSFLLGLTTFGTGFTVSAGLGLPGESSYPRLADDANLAAGRAFAASFAARYEAGEVIAGDEMEVRWQTEGGRASVVLTHLRSNAPTGNAVQTTEGTAALFCESFEGTVRGDIPAIRLPPGSRDHGRVLLCSSMGEGAVEAFVGVQLEGGPLRFQALGARVDGAPIRPPGDGTAPE